MPETGVVFDEPLLQGAFSGKERFNRKVLALSSLLIGFGCVYLLSSEPRNHTEVPQLEIESPGLSMAAQIPQLAGSRQIVQPISSSLSMRSAKFLPFIQPLQTWLPMRSSMDSHSKGFKMQAVRIQGGPTVRYDDWNSDEGQERGSEEGEGATGTGKVARWNSDRGFGFVQPDDGGEDLFCHVTSLVDGEGSVDRGDFVTFVKQYNDRNGKYEASEVRLDTTKEKPVLEEEEGVVIKWNDERGFGFILPSKGGDDVFCHATSVARGESPAVRDKVSFVSEYNEGKGKYEATNVKILEKGTGELPREGPGENAVEAKGQLASWNSERGFGFIRPEDGDEDLFVHVSALDGGEGSAKEGDLVSYVKDFNERKGNYQAYQVKYLGEGPPLYADEEGEEGQDQIEGSQEGEESGDRPEETQEVVVSSERPAKSQRPAKRAKELVS